MKKAVFVCLFPLLFSLFLLAASAEEVITVEEIDPFTGEAYTSDEEKGDTEGTMIRIAENRYYDESMRMFAYTVGEVSDKPIYASAAYGMVTTENVRIELPDGVSAELYCDGELVEDPYFPRIDEPGAYVVSVSGNSAGSAEPIRFTIVNRTSCMDSYRLPDGFMVTSVLREALPVASAPLEVDFSNEGFYEIEYLCTATGNTYSLKLTIDHTPPTLALEGVVEHAAHGPVDISDIEPDAAVSITLDGSPIRYRDILTQSGKYHILLRDPAGNCAEYDFTIMIYFNMTSYMFAVLLVGGIAALILYLVYSRRRLRVR